MTKDHRDLTEEEHLACLDIHTLMVEGEAAIFAREHERLKDPTYAGTQRPYRWTADDLGTDLGTTMIYRNTQGGPLNGLRVQVSVKVLP